MMLIAIGESLKSLDKITHGTLLKRYPEIDWKGAKGIRDILSHHYFDLDAEVFMEPVRRKFQP
ncbi:MAG: HepT-like ribonuclease domain-containing protein [Sedimenticola sp.]